jgi:hypothetical protein
MMFAPEVRTEFFLGNPLAFSGSLLLAVVLRCCLLLWWPVLFFLGLLFLLFLPFLFVRLLLLFIRLLLLWGRRRLLLWLWLWLVVGLLRRLCFRFRLLFWFLLFGLLLLIRLWRENRRTRDGRCQHAAQNDFHRLLRPWSSIFVRYGEDSTAFRLAGKAKRLLQADTCRARMAFAVVKARSRLREKLV